MSKKTSIEFKNVSKIFSGHRALDSVSFTILEGEVHALLGENGAGKSTLLNILHGVYSEYDGDVCINGEKVNFDNVHDAIKLGIAKVHQEVSVIPELTVGQNITLGCEPKRGVFVDYKELHRQTDEILKRLKCKFKSTDLAGTLSAGEMQMLSIAKALFHKVKVISFDEPTAALSDNEVNTFFTIINELKNNGITIIYVSHRLNEIFKIADRASILRDGKYICTYDVESITRENLIQRMVGRDVSAFAVRNKPYCAKDEIVLDVKNLTKDGVFYDISFNLRKGEILGFAGLVGSKRTDVVRAIFGADVRTGGDIYVRGEKANINAPSDALKYGIGLIPENRKTQGFIKMMTNANNVGLASMKKFTHKGFLHYKKIIENCQHYSNQINLNPKDPMYITENLSGGNQQKVIIAKWLSTNADILIFDEPTKGVDVGAKAEIYRLMEELLEQGKSIIMVSSELTEIIGMSDRVMVMREGHLISELDSSELSEERVLHFAMEGEKHLEK